MNWDQLPSRWKQSKSKFREKWGKLSEDDLDVIAGGRDQLVSRIQERYGLPKEVAQEQADAFVYALEDDTPADIAATQRTADERKHASH